MTEEYRRTKLPAVHSQKFLDELREKMSIPLEEAEYLRRKFYEAFPDVLTLTGMRASRSRFPDRERRRAGL